MYTEKTAKEWLKALPKSAARKVKRDIYRSRDTPLYFINMSYKMTLFIFLVYSGCYEIQKNKKYYDGICDYI